MSDLDCDVCHPELHDLCKAEEYDGAAPMGRRPGTPPTHRRCAEHR